MSANDYLPVRVSTLRGKLEISFDLYVLVNERFICYCRKGDHFHGDRLDRLKKKNLKKMYILKEHEEHYKTYLRKNIDLAYSSTNEEIEDRALVIQGAQQALTENLMESPDDNNLFELAVESSRKYVEFILNENHALRSILQIENPDNNYAHHGLNVATLAVGICKHFENSKPDDLNALVIGCLLHDIDHFYTGMPFHTPIKDMPIELKDAYFAHTKNGAERIRFAGFYHPLSVAIVEQHEEKIDGSGFPQKLKEEDMHPLVTMAAACNSFDRLMGFEGLSPKEALKRILIEGMGVHPLKYLQALQEVLKKESML